MGEIRLIATDLDNTFLASDHLPSAQSVAAVKAVQKAGIRVCACSGRNYTELKDLCELGGLDELAIINNGIIGDGPNDVSMLLAAGLGVAMGNAVRALLDVADAVTDSVAEEGFSKALYRYALQRD